MLDTLSFPYQVKLNDAREYVYFCRSWWDGIGNDIALWKRLDNADCIYGCYVTGETTVPIPMRTLVERRIETTYFNELINQILSLEFLDMKSQYKSIILTHFDDIYGIRTSDSSQFQYIVRCGKHLDPRNQTIRTYLLTQAPELQQHFQNEYRK